MVQSIKNIKFFIRFLFIQDQSWEAENFVQDRRTNRHWHSMISCQSLKNRIPVFIVILHFIYFMFIFKFASSLLQVYSTQRNEMLSC